ncbi:MAG: hypothetical protein HYY65_00905 [Candidatus Tectomicrobia bacterium]|uniref:Type IV pilus secretin PilQ n=1 Tax=Tectimicrobiota bacterium TaxID=2528274 RepID=A0A932GMC2_UNCTE|nr:hypothetical protein [Candidatus Tectomicrobia bacterium]
MRISCHGPGYPQSGCHPCIMKSPLTPLFQRGERGDFLSSVVGRAGILGIILLVAASGCAGVRGVVPGQHIAPISETQFLLSVEGLSFPRVTRVILRGSQNFELVVDELSPEKDLISLDFPGARSVVSPPRVLINRGSVGAAQVTQEEKGAGVRLELKQPRPYKIFRSGAVLWVDVEEPEPASKQVTGEIPVVQPQQLAGEGLQGKRNEVQKSSPAEEPDPLREIPLLERAGRLGQPISLKARDTEMKDLLRSVSKLLGVGLLVDEEIKDRVTLEVKEVPIRDLLRTLIRDYGLSLQQQGEMISVRKLKFDSRVVFLRHASAERLSQTIKELKVAEGTSVSSDPRTNALIFQGDPEDLRRLLELVQALDAEGTSASSKLKTRIVYLKYARVGEFQRKILDQTVTEKGFDETLKSLLSEVSKGGVGAGGKGESGGGDILSSRIAFDKRTNAVIIRDLPEVVDRIVPLIEEMDKSLPQISIEARIVQTDATFARELGIQWGGKYTKGGHFGNTVIQGGMVPLTNTAGGIVGTTPGGGNMVVDLPAAVGRGVGGAAGVSLGNLARGLVLDLQLSALETEGKARVISRPSIVTLANQEALIESGTEFNVRVRTEGTQGTISSDLKEVDATLRLRVRPYITPEGKIFMDIQAEQREPDFSRVVDGIPAIQKNSAFTQLMVDDGATAVIGGLFRQKSSDNAKQVPGVSRIPILGWLFKNQSRSESLTELMIFITPKVLQGEEILGIRKMGGPNPGAKGFAGPQ